MDMAANNDPRNWTEELVSGHQVIDEQHRELLRRFEMLEDAIKKGQGFDEVRALIAFLQRYVLTHFNTEEQVMIAGRYPASAHHVKEHDECKNRIFQFKRFIETESDAKKIISVAYSMLGIWVRDHILNHDIQFIQYVKEKKKGNAEMNVEYDWSPESSQLWLPEYEIGVPEIDAQHQNLVKWTEYVQNSNYLSEKLLLNLLDFIHGFIFTHFTDEELFMIDVQFPNSEAHSQQHNVVRSKFFEIKKLSGDSDARHMRSAVLDLFQIYVKHIGTIDIEFKKYVTH